MNYWLIWIPNKNQFFIKGVSKCMTREEAAFSSKGRCSFTRKKRMGNCRSSPGLIQVRLSVAMFIQINSWLFRSLAMHFIPNRITSCLFLFHFYQSSETKDFFLALVQRAVQF
jgi:hypothetical protein